MEFAIKFFPGYFSATPTRTVQEISSLEIVSDVSAVSYAKFSVDVSVTGISTFQKVEVWKVWIPDAMIFRGFVSNVRPSLNSVEVEAKSEKSLLAYKVATVDRTFSGSTISASVGQLLSDWASAYGETFSVTSSLSTPITKDVKAGDSIYNVVDEIARLAWAVWTCEDGEIRIETVLGTDYTSPGNFKELTFDGTDPKRSNVASFTLESYGSVANVIMATDGTSKAFVDDSASRAQFGALAEVKDFRTGALSANASAYLAYKKDEQSVFKVVPEPERFEAEVGDKVALTIENANEYLNFSGSVVVTRKKTVLRNASAVSEYEVAERYVSKSGFVQRFVEIEKDVDLSKIR